MKCRKAYAIIPVGENDRSAHVAQQKAPEVATPGLFYSVLGGWLNPKAGYQLFFSVRFVTSPCASLSVPAEESKGWSATIFYLLYSLIGKPKLILQIKNKPLTVSLLHFQSRPRGSKLHYILGRIYARIYPLDIGCLSCYNMCSGYIASSLKCYHFRTCEGGKPPFNPPFKRAGRLII